MGRSRMGTAEVAAEAGCLERRLGGDAGFFCEKVSDLGPRTVVLQLQRSGQRSGTGEAEKVHVVLESGVRFHATRFPLERPDHPSNFAMKLRKHLKQKRLVRVSQVGLDRVVDFEFERAGGTNHLLLELYARGNVVLTDGDYKVLTLLRSHRDDAAGIEATMANRPYPLSQARDSEVGACGEAFLAAALRGGEPDAGGAEGDGRGDAKECAAGHHNKVQARGRREDGTLGGLLRSLCPYGPAVADHCLITSGLKPGAALADGVPAREDLEQVCEALREFENWIVAARQQGCPGAVFTRIAQMATSQGSSEDQGVEVFEGYESFPLMQFAGRTKKGFETFDEALDEYYHGLQSQQASLQQHRQEQQVLKKLDKVKNDFNVRQQALEAQAASSDQKAGLIELNLALVDLVIQTTNEAIASGMSWGDLGRMVAQGRESGNEVAAAIHSLQLEDNRITLSLKDPYDLDSQSCSVSIDLGISAHANARQLYSARKRHIEKQTKTSDASHKVVKKAERTAKAEMKKVQVAASVREVRQQLWFEKFHWFVSSEKFLIIAGRDPTQNEIVMRRHFQPGDVLVHADLRGAPCCVVKNPKAAAVPPSTLAQAGTFCTCLSEAWKAKVVTSAWWASHSQVELAGACTPGEPFKVSGKRNLLPPARLVMGLSILFKEQCDEGEHEDEMAEPVLGELLGSGDGQALDAAEEVPSTQRDPDSADFLEAVGNMEIEVAPPGGGGGSVSDASSEDGVTTVSRGIVEVAERGGAGSDSEDDVLDALTTPMVGSSNKSSMSQDSAGRGSEVPVSSGSTSNHDTGHRYLTAKQRRDQKKFVQSEGNATPEVQEKPKDPARGFPEGAKVAKPQPQKKVRGKHGKNKKIKAKYMDQDEEDRALMMELLGSAKPKAPSVKAVPRGSEPPADIHKGTGGESQLRKGRQFGGPKPAAHRLRPPTQEEDPEAAAEMKKIEAQRERSRRAALRGLTGCPREDSPLFYGMAMLAPYAAIQNCKFKVKLTPGSGKRGKMGKSAQTVLAATPGATPREKDLVMAIGGDELARTMMGNVKVSGATRGNAKKH